MEFERRTVLKASLLAAIPFGGAAEASTGTRPGVFRDPPSDARPKVRWVWPGVAVEDAELVAEIEEIAAAGFGGVEISTIQWGLPATGNPPETCAWGTAFWVDRIRTALRAGAAHGVGVDTAVGPAFPWASPAVSGARKDLSQHELLGAHQVLEGPASFTGPPPRPSGLDETQARLTAVTAAERLDTTLLDPRGAVDLTSLVDAHGQLHWEVPAGTWVLSGCWQQPTGQHASSGTPICELPLVVDHMRRESAEAALARLDTALVRELGPLRGNLHELTEDSLELRRKGVFWTPAFLAEFRERRGYDLTRYLTALLGDYAFPGDAGERVRRDYHQTVTELWVGGHLAPATRWARERGLEFRSQVYGDYPPGTPVAQPIGGQAFDTIAAAKAVGVPEVEDLYANTLDFWKTLSSGAHLSGAAKVSMEFGAVANQEYMITLAELKRRADKAFAGGVNQIVLHVYPYKKANGATWPSWNPWSSEFSTAPFGFSDGWNGTNPQWPHLRPLIDYVARAQLLLRSGIPVNDIAVYRDIYGYPTSLTGGLDSPEPALNAALSRAGLSFDFIDPGTLTEPATRVRDGRLAVQPPGYRALVVDLGAAAVSAVDNTRAMAAEVARRLVSFARSGLPIVFAGHFPERGVSYRDPGREDADLLAAVAELRRSPRVRLVEDPAGVPGALAELGAGGDLSFDHPQDQVYGVHRRTGDGDYWFLWNGGDRPARFEGSFAATGAPETWDLWTGQVNPLARYRVRGDRVRVPLDLAPRESVVLGFGGATHLSDGTTAAGLGPLPPAVDLTAWQLQVVGAVPEGDDRHDLTLTELKDWREIPALANTSGLGTYRTVIRLDSAWTASGRGACLDLGRVEGTVQVRVNGRLVSPACVPLPRFDVGEFLRTGENTIEIELTTTLKNRLVALAKQGNPAYKRFLTRSATQPYGLIGPVRLLPGRQPGGLV